MKKNMMKSIITVSTLAISSFIVTPVFANDAFTGHTTANQHVTAPSPLKQTYTVGLNKTEIVHLPTAASAILVGNPSIADVSIHSSNIFFVVGRSYGETNILILDDQGHTILDTNIQVNNILPRNGIRVFYGASDRETYNCTPSCTAAPVLGDRPGFIAANSASSPVIDNTIALGSAQSSSNSGGADTGGNSLQGGGQLNLGEQ